jgi:RNA polymerase sigma-70 factor (ECF subfamily)
MQPNDATDGELMCAYANGDEHAFGVLFNRYSPKLNLFLRLRLALKKSHLIDEIYQKTWLKIHSARKSFDSAKSFSSWFYTIALNTLRDEVGQAAEKFVHEEINDHESGSEVNTEELYILKESTEKVYAILAQLPENQRMALLLSDREELSSREIAETMGISDAATRKLISRARKKVRDSLAERGLA